MIYTFCIVFSLFVPIHLLVLMSWLFGWRNSFVENNNLLLYIWARLVMGFCLFWRVGFSAGTGETLFRAITFLYTWALLVTFELSVVWFFIHAAPNHQKGYISVYSDQIWERPQEQLSNIKMITRAIVSHENDHKSKLQRRSVMNLTCAQLRLIIEGPTCKDCMWLKQRKLVKKRRGNLCLVLDNAFLV